MKNCCERIKDRKVKEKRLELKQDNWKIKEDHGE
jgi:hypothetical protein